jgi:phosphoribosylformylglycinamidine cyclo-ligase
MGDSTKPDPYAAAGIRYDVMDTGKLQAQRAAEATATRLSARGLAEVAASRGESAYVVDLGDRYLSQVTEALGTKNLVADAVSRITGRSHYDAIARDTVATILNDLATVGGHPVSLTAYWGFGSSDWFHDGSRMSDLVDGWADACHAAGCAWGGGETQVLVGAIEPHAAVLGGSAVGLVAPKGRLLVGSRVAAGDAILIAPATGIHANGLSLARKIAGELPGGYATPVPRDPTGRRFGEVLLDATPLYGPLVEAVQTAAVDLHYVVNVTGHGWRKLMRAPQALSYIVDRLPDVNPIYDVLCATMTLSDQYGTFNMGAGYVLYVSEADAERAVAAAAQAGFTLLHAGSVEAGPKRVVLRPNGVTFEGASLQIR